MDRSAVKAVVERNISSLADAIGICHWRLTVSYEPVSGTGIPGADGEASGNCKRLLDYERAFITIDPADFDDEEDVLECLRHELFHVALAPFDLIATYAGDSLTGAAQARFDRVWRHAMESGVRNLERLWAGAELYWRERERTDMAKAKNPKITKSAAAKKMTGGAPKKPPFPGAAKPYGAKGKGVPKGMKGKGK